MAIKTNIDHVDNVREIYGFISYNDYLNLPYFREYVAQNNVELPKKVEPKKKNVEEVVVKPVNERVKLNVCAVIAILLGWAYAIWSLLGYFVTMPEVVSELFIMYDGNTIVEIVTGLIEGGSSDILLLVRDIVFLVSVFISVFVLVGSHANLKIKCAGKVLKVAASLLFITALATAVITLIKVSTLTMGMAIEVIIALFIAFATIASPKKVK